MNPENRPAPPVWAGQACHAHPDRPAAAVRGVDGVTLPVCWTCAEAASDSVSGAVEEPCSSCVGAGCVDCDYTGERIAELRYGGM